MIHLSSVTGDGLEQWYDWLGGRMPASPPSVPLSVPPSVRALRVRTGPGPRR
jgi:hypothetical protein